tara:strand:- start:7651 stop:8466 length:816 start_codon:yes stop_codon:yes gene_type:complete
MKKQIITLSIICLSFNAFSQKVEYLPASRFAPTPVAGKDYLKEHIKQELNYPIELLEKEESGEVFIRFLVTNDGVVETAKVTATTNEGFNEEALRYFHTIVWKKDYIRRINPDILDGIRIKFNPKQYKKTVKKRGYERTQSLTAIPQSQTNQIYTKQQLDSLPNLLSGGTMNEFAAENLKYPQEAITRKVGGVVKYNFIIEPYGIASNFELVDAVAGGCNEETLRILKLMRWTPAIKDGKAVRTKMEFSLLFNASGSGGYQMFDGNSNSSD